MKKWPRVLLLVMEFKVILTAHTSWHIRCIDPRDGTENLEHNLGGEIVAAELGMGSAAHLERQECEGFFAPREVGIAFQGYVQGDE